MSNLGTETSDTLGFMKKEFGKRDVNRRTPTPTKKAVASVLKSGAKKLGKKAMSLDDCNTLLSDLKILLLANENEEKLIDTFLGMRNTAFAKNRFEKLKKLSKIVC